MIRQAVLEYDHADDALDRLDDLVDGRRAHVLHGQKGYDVVRAIFPAIADYPATRFSGECTDSEVKRLKPLDADVLIAVGGGKLVDTAKLVAYQRNVPLIVVPTLASNCAAFTPLSVVYQEDGSYDRYDMFRVVIERVIVDSRVISRSPYEYFRAGVIDTVAKFYEARYLSGDSSADAGVNTGLVLAEQCGRLVELELSEHAFESYSDDVRFAVDHVLAIGGAVGGFGDAGTRVAVGHAVHNALSRFESTHSFLHGDKVGFGLIIQERLRRSADAPYLEAWLKRFGAPTTLETLGVGFEHIPVLVDSVMTETELQQLPEPLDKNFLKKIFENLQLSIYN
ncbi:MULTISPECIES: iron-containing alcohol dehydrogenase family protein [unclassified Exiguobacterium]|uniref:iron-containing alcohol dehydrogenase family protein n=1 Tax=unclassified Exiguobacterium TaxID=2644629 RepID=UPI00103C81AD|nr:MULTISPECIES: iron-containing alcohol dehydrogenase family protein [unclassified Exiguobacterium]TCI67678.1 iron-containing alcohol dehydrogenase [Exiguobacterium sp. IPCI3]TCI77184.1 iron-containing alcohol dehydrogenase [Exiguobacterium sp. IPCH1]TCI78743.1 iron-containing alcohol dehydrogenase [Exiguobacterium sp. IPBC4]